MNIRSSIIIIIIDTGNATPDSAIVQDCDFFNHCKNYWKCKITNMGPTVTREKKFQLIHSK